MPGLRARVPSPRTQGLTIARVAGIPIVIHGTWLILVGLIAFWGAPEIARDVVHDPSQAVVLAVGVLFAVIISACILVHELAHSIVARGYGMRVRGITLFMLGGVSQIEQEAPRPRSEFFVAVAGPLASIVIASTFAVVSRALNPNIEGLPGIWGAIAIVNGYLALFNLIPAFPMDGGRILRSALWAGIGRRARATRLAASAGRAFALLMIGAGALSVVGSLAGRGEGDGVFLLLVGLFLFNAAGAAEQAEGGDLPNEPGAPR